MNKNLKTSWRKIRHNDLQKSFQVLEKVFESFGIDFFVVGALARDIWAGIGDVNIPAATRDMDVAVFIPDREHFDSIKQKLIDEYGFRGRKKNQFVLLAPDNTIIDLIPFGDIADLSEEVTVNGMGFTSMSVAGFKDVHQKGIEEVEVDEDLFDVCSIPGIVLLKLIAWDDRPDRRQQDIKDIRFLIENIFDFFDEEIHSNHLDLFKLYSESSDVRRLVGIHFLGRKIYRLIQDNDALLKRVVGVLNRELKSFANSTMLRVMIQGSELNIEKAANLIKILKIGIEEDL